MIEESLLFRSEIWFCFYFQVFAGVYPVDQSEHLYLRSAIEKLTLNDSSVSVNPDSWYEPYLRNGPYFFLRVGWAISKDNSCTANTAEKKFVQGKPWGRKKSSKCFLLSSSCVSLKKIVAQAASHPKKLCKNLGEKKI